MAENYPKGAPNTVTYPYRSGDVLVLGPQMFVSADGSVINWRGENYYRGDDESYLDHPPLV